MRSARFLLLLLATLFCIRLAPAQPAEPAPTGAAAATATPEGTAGAEDAGALFDRGLEAMMAERYEEGCPMLARSFELEPLAGAEFTLAECFAKWGKTASALKHYRGYLEKVDAMTDEDKRKQGPRVGVAQEQVPALEKTVPSLLLKLPPEAPSGTEVELDGVRVLYLGTRQNVDPGDHRALVKLPTGETQEKIVTVAAAERADVMLELPGTPGGDEEPDVGSDDGDNMRITGLVVGGVGIAAVAVSLILGGAALGEKGDIEDNCTDYVCNAKGKRAADSAQGLALGSTVAFVIGLVAVAAGTTIYLLAPDSEVAGEGDADGDGEGEGLDAEVTVSGLAGDPLSATLGMRWRW